MFFCFRQFLFIYLFADELLLGYREMGKEDACACVCSAFALHNETVRHTTHSRGTHTHTPHAQHRSQIADVLSWGVSGRGYPFR
jgi:hypothetical protein